VFREVKQVALALLRTMKRHHDEHDPATLLSEGANLASELLAERARLKPTSLRYEKAGFAYLVLEGALVWEERLGSVPGVDLYRITERGLDMPGTSYTYHLLTLRPSSRFLGNVGSGGTPYLFRSIERRQSEHLRLCHGGAERAAFRRCWPITRHPPGSGAGQGYVDQHALYGS
jgi:hypothetical protein